VIPICTLPFRFIATKPARAGCDGVPYRSIAVQLSITVAQAEHAARRVSDRMRDAVRDILREEGVLPNAMDAAVAEVLLLVDEAAGEP
jgi:hypothetical protein